MKRAVLAISLAGCAGPIDVARTVTPNEAVSANGTGFHAVAIVRGDARATLPANATIGAEEGHAPEVRVPRPDVFAYSLDPGETVVRDAKGVITGVKGADGADTARFIPGTATVDENEVRGELVDHVERVPLLANDRVELRGRFSPGDNVPTGGHVETTRVWPALVVGGVLLGGAWIPSVVVGATSAAASEHWLYVPAIGPWIALAARDACAVGDDPRPCISDGFARIGLIVDGVLQAGGTVITILGLPTNTEVKWGKQGKLRVEPGLGGLVVRGVF